MLGFRTGFRTYPAVFPPKDSRSSSRFSLVAFRKTTRSISCIAVPDIFLRSVVVYSSFFFVAWYCLQAVAVKCSRRLPSIDSVSFPDLLVAWIFSERTRSNPGFCLDISERSRSISRCAIVDWIFSSSCCLGFTPGFLQEFRRDFLIYFRLISI